MDAISILSGLKGKVLDAKNYELLRHTYDLQNDNIEQLKTSNKLFKETTERLQEQVNGLRTEKESLKQTVAELTQRISQLNEDSVSSALSDVAVAILELYSKYDKTILWDKSEIIPALNFRTIQTESGIDELVSTEMIRIVRGGGEGYLAYELTNKGKKHLA